MAEENEGVGGKGVIPHFFYDVISFIIPGSYLLFGGFLIWFGQQWSVALCHWMATGEKQEGSIAAISVLAGILFILFLGISSFIGFLLSALSYQTVERIWGAINPYTMPGLKDYMGSEGQEEKLKERFKEMFGRDLENPNCNLDRASNLCAYYIWDHSPLLGTITCRFDAEKIMSQSSILVSFLLAGLDLVHYVYAVLVCGAPSPSAFAAYLFGILLCMIGSSFAFTFYREKRVYGRYQIFIVLVAKQEMMDAKQENRKRRDSSGEVDKT